MPRTHSPAVRDELVLSERVGGELMRLGLNPHVKRVREYYAAIAAGRPTSGVWSHEMNVEWMRILRLPPYEDDYPVRPRMAPCSACDVSRPFTAAVFPGGSKHQCACGAVWLELDADVTFSR